MAEYSMQQRQHPEVVEIDSAGRMAGHDNHKHPRAGFYLHSYRSFPTLLPERTLQKIKAAPYI